MRDEKLEIEPTIAGVDRKWNMFYILRLMDGIVNVN